MGSTQCAIVRLSSGFYHARHEHDNRPATRVRGREGEPMSTSTIVAGVGMIPFTRPVALNEKVSP